MGEGGEARLLPSPAREQPQRADHPERFWVRARREWFSEKQAKHHRHRDDDERRRRRRPSTTPEAGAGASRRSSRSRWSWSRPNPGFQTTHRARGELSLFLFPFSCASAFLDRANDRPWILTPQPTLSSAIQLSVLRAQAPGFPEGPRRAGAPGPAPGLAALAPVGLRLLVRDAAQGGSDDPDRPGAPTSGRPCEEEAQPAAEDQAGGVSAAQR